MTPIQIVLVLAILVLGIAYFRAFRNKLLNRLIFVGLFLMGIMAVLFPESTNKLANLVGVGRGADLLTYLLVLIFYASFLHLYSKISAIERQQTLIIRKIAILEAKSLSLREEE